MRDVEERLKKARAAAEAATERAQNSADELEEARTTVEAAKRAVEDASKELESLFGETRAR